MTNEEKYKYKNVKIMLKAHSKYCRKTEGSDYCIERGCRQCILEWLYSEAEEDLLPCPFCSGEAELNRSVESWVECTVCHNRTEMCACDNGAIEKWNRRVGQ